MDDNCQLNTKISDDGMTAVLITPHGFDHTKLNQELCKAMIMRGGIELSATKPELIDQFIEEAKAATEGGHHGIIARGTEPRHGSDGHIEWLVKEPTPTTPTENAPENPEGATDADVSFYERSAFIVVKAGDVLGKIHPPTHGQDGRDVTGKNIAAREGRDYDFKHDESLMVGKGNMVLAQADGLLDRSGNTICIRDTISVDEYVDFNTGNISFNGNIEIRKGVRDCFKVQADGDIEVQGLIEAATIIAGGELRALGGFAGRERGTANIKGDLIAKYLDAVEVNVRGNLCVDRELINCNTEVLGGIDSPRGAIIGGDTLVAGRVEVAELGAEGLPQTTVQINVVPHLDPLIHDLERIIDGLIDDRDKLVEEQEMIQKTSGSRVTSQHKERLCELMYEIAEVQALLDRAEPSIEKVREKADSMRLADVTVHKKVHPNTVLVCDGLSYKVKNEIKGPVRIFPDSKGHLQLQYDGAPPSKLSRQADLADAA